MASRGNIINVDFTAGQNQPETTEKDAEMERVQHPEKSVVVLHTSDGFRVGIVTRKDFLDGLRRLDTDKHRLNPAVARRCFSDSPRYSDANAATKAAEKIPSEYGVKVFHFPEDTFPSLNPIAA